MKVLNNIFKYIKKKSISSAILIAFVGIFGWVKLYILPSSVATVIETMSESYGLDITIDDLTTEISDFKVNLENVVWHVDGRYSSNELFKAEQISFDLSLIKFFSSGFDIATALQEVAVRDATLHIEHKNSNRWNWQDAFTGKKILRYVNRQHGNDITAVNSSGDAQEELGQDGEGSDFSFSVVKFDGLGIVWIEELPSNSGDGTIVRSRSELFIDDVSLIVKNIIGVFQDNAQPMEIDFDGRTADGIIQASGEINLFSWGIPIASNGVFRPVARKRNAGQLVWMPTFDLDLYLENIGAAALGQMVPDSAINATGGAMSGEIKIALNLDQVVDFSTNISLSNMSWTINEESEVNKGQNLTYAKKGLNNFKNKNKEIVVSSKGRISDPNFRVVPSLQTAITREAVSDAPKSVRRVASRDQLRFEDPKLSPYAQNVAKTEQAIEQGNEIATTMEKAQRLGNRFKKFIPFKKFPF